MALVAAAVSLGCGAPAVQPTTEVRTRRQNPLPVCTMPLSPIAISGAKAVVRSLEPEQWMQAIIPAFASSGNAIGSSDVDCTGDYVFANETLRGGVSVGGFPHKLRADELDERAGPDGLRVLWLPMLNFENGDVGGPIALVRAIDDRAEVYGVGSLRAAAKSKATPVRLGNDTIVMVESSLCPNPQEDCQKVAHVFLNRRGRLYEAATVDLERTAIVPSITERGLYAQYKLRTDVEYKPDGIHLLEQVKVRIIHYDAPNRDSDRDLRQVEFARVLRVERDALFSSNDPLWERVVGQD
jgi:hypothetical protein